METEQAVTCKYPGCEQPPAPADGPGRPPAYCTNPDHTALKAWRERQRLAASQAGTTVSDADDRAARDDGPGVGAGDAPRDARAWPTG